jgi:hypothetical protein
MSDIQFADKRIYPKIEVTYGVDSVPTAAERVRTRGVAFKNYDGEKQTQEYDGDGGRFRPSVNIGPYSSMSFDIDMAGSGTLDLAPNYKDILQVCGIDVVENAATNVTMTPRTTPITDSLSMYFVRGEDTGMQLAKSLGMRGEIGLQLNRGQVALWNVKNMLGSYIQPAYNAVPLAGTPANQEEGLPITFVNTPTATLDSEDVCIESFTLDNVGHSVVYRNTANCLEVASLPQQITGSITIKDVGYNTKNWVAAAESHAGITQVPLQIVHGITAGNIMTLDASDVQIIDIDETDINGVKAWNLALSFLAVPVITQT